jgi:hypothetical protein
MIDSNPDHIAPDRADDGHETIEERTRRFEQQKVAPESETRKSPDGPGAQISPEIEPSGS